MVRRTRRLIDLAWQSFVVDGRLPDAVRPEIGRSWQRVRNGCNVDPALRTCPRAAGGDDALARAQEDDIFRVASRVVSHFADRLKADGHVIAYFGGDGVMLTLQGNERTRSRLADVNFAPGACWSEQVAGTNGPGTALVEERPVEVLASEHFVEAWQPWACASVPVRVGPTVVGAVDITTRWKARSPSLLPTAEALAHAIEARIDAEVERARGEILLRTARDALGSREEFLSVASHELKTPLTPLRARIHLAQRMLERGASAGAPGELAEALRGIDGHVDRLVDVLDHLLQASRVAREPLWPVPEQCDLGALVWDVVGRRTSELRRLGCDVAVSARPGIVGRWDRALVEEALKQLLVNAAKYAPGRIEVEVTEDGGRARVLVHDHGPGIDPRDQSRIFDRWERAVSYRHTAGFGLGLDLVRRIAEAHGGTALVDSTLGKGSTFVLELPVER